MYTYLYTLDGTMSHHVTIYLSDGTKIGYIRKTNDDVVLSVWISQVYGAGQLFLPEDGIANEPLDVKE